MRRCARATTARALPALLLALVGVSAASTAVGDEARRLERAIELYAQQRVEEARMLLDALVRDEPRNHRALWNRGLLALHDGKPGEAIDWFARAIAVDDTEAEYHLWLGYAYAQRVRRVHLLRKPFVAAKCRRALERAVDLAPDDLRGRRALQRFYEEAPFFVGGSRDKARAQAEAIARLERASRP